MSVIAQLVDSSGVRRFSFKDSLFTVPNLERMASELQTRKIDIEWSATTLLHRSLSYERLQGLAASGCRTIEFGLETIDAQGQQLFDKRLDLRMVEDVIKAATDAGITVVLNQILGFPHQTLESAERQLSWYAKLRSDAPDRIRASFNMLEVNRSSQMARAPHEFGIDIGDVAPWAFSFTWNAPSWRKALSCRIRDEFPA